MFIVFRAVFSVEKNAEKYSFARYSSTQSNRRIMSKRVLIQGILYSTVLVLTMMFPLCQAFFSGVTSVPDFVRVLTVTFTPWQGFFNAIIYSMPRLLNWRRESQNSESTRFSSNRWSYNLSSVSWANSLRNSSKTFSFLILKRSTKKCSAPSGDANDEPCSLKKECDGYKGAEHFKLCACSKHDENNSIQSTFHKLLEADNIASQDDATSQFIKQAGDHDQGHVLSTNMVNENHDDVAGENGPEDYNDSSSKYRRKSVTFQETQRFDEDDSLHPQAAYDSEENEYEGEPYQETFLPHDVISEHEYEQDDIHLYMIH